MEYTRFINKVSYGLSFLIFQVLHIYMEFFMKKTTKILSIALVLFAGLIISSCDLFNQIKDAVEDTYDTWYKYNGESLDLPVTANANADDENPSGSELLKKAQIYVLFNETKGLTLAVQAQSSENVSLLGNLVSTEVKVTTGSVKQYTLDEFSATKWSVLALSGKFDECKIPEVAISPTPAGVILLNDPKAAGFNLQWKKVLRDILIDKLLGDI